jgi:hypothetical protein
MSNRKAQCQQHQRYAEVGDNGQALAIVSIDENSRKRTLPHGSQHGDNENLPHVTLLLFDRKGQLRKVLSGVKSDEVLQRVFELHLQRWG